MISFCPICQLGAEPWMALETNDGLDVSCEKHGPLTREQLLNAGFELGLLGKSLHYLEVQLALCNADTHKSIHPPVIES